MTTHQSNDNEKVISIMSRNSEIAYRFYKQRFYNAMGDYRHWRHANQNEYAMVTEWKSLLEGAELRNKAEMWLSICLRLKEHIYKKHHSH